MKELSHFNVTQDIFSKTMPMRNTLNIVKNSNSYSLQTTKEYYSTDFFFFGNNFSGITSRSHTNMIFNVGNGGKISPTLVVE